MSKHFGLTAEEWNELTVAQRQRWIEFYIDTPRAHKDRDAKPADTTKWPFVNTPGLIQASGPRIINEGFDWWK